MLSKPLLDSLGPLRQALVLEVEQFIDAVHISERKYKSGRSYADPDKVNIICDRCDEPAVWKYEKTIPEYDEYLEDYVDVIYEEFRCVYHSSRGRYRKSDVLVPTLMPKIDFRMLGETVIVDSMHRCDVTLRDELMDNAMKQIFTLLETRRDINQVVEKIRKQIKEPLKSDLRAEAKVFEPRKSMPPLKSEAYTVNLPKVIPRDRYKFPDVYVNAPLVRSNYYTADFGQEIKVNIPKVKKRTHVRGGKGRMLGNKGECYLALLPRALRSEAKRVMGNNPPLSMVADYVSNKPLLYDRILHYVSPIQAHVKFDKRYDLRYQIESNNVSNPMSYVGCEDPDYAQKKAEEEEEAKLFKENPWFKFHTADAEEIESEDEEDESESSDDDEEEDEPEATSEDFKVGGNGYCWSKLWFLHSVFHLKDETGKMSGRLILEKCKENYKRYHDIELVYDCSGVDIHIEHVRLPNGQSSYRPDVHPPVREMDWFPFKYFIEDLEVSLKACDKFVGKGGPATSAYDTATQQIVTAENRRTLENLKILPITKAHAHMEKIMPYAVPSHNQTYANELGIPWSKTSAMVHPHPLHYEVRREQVYSVLPSHIKTDTTVISMSRGNYDLLLKGLENKGMSHKVSLKNPICDIKDISRYAGKGDVPIAVFNVDVIDTPTAIMHDSGHYLSPELITRLFAKNTQLQYLIVTHVYPLAALYSDSSPDKTLYEFRKVGDTLIYIPEQDDGNIYEQPLEPTLLLARSLHDPVKAISLRGGIVHSKLNSHVQVWQRYNLVVPKYQALTMRTMMKIPRVFRGQPKDLCMIPTEYWWKLYQYGKTLGKIKPEDLWGKLRQFTDQQDYHMPIADLEWLINVVICALSWKTVPGLQTKGIDGFWHEIYYRTVGHLVRWKHKKFDMKYANRKRYLMNQPHPIQPLPLIDVTVRSHGYQTYGVEWTVPNEFKDSFFWVMENFFRDLFKIDCEKPIDSVMSIDAGGKLVWNNVSCNERMVKRFGVDLVHASQINKYLSTFEAGVPNPQVLAKEFKAPNARINNLAEKPYGEEIFPDEHPINVGASHGFAWDKYASVGMASMVSLIRFREWEEEEENRIIDRGSEYSNNNGYSMSTTYVGTQDDSDNTYDSSSTDSDDDSCIIKKPHCDNCPGFYDWIDLENGHTNYTQYIQWCVAKHERSLGKGKLLTKAKYQFDEEDELKVNLPKPKVDPEPVVGPEQIKEKAVVVYQQPDPGIYPTLHRKISQSSIKTDRTTSYLENKKEWDKISNARPPIDVTAFQYKGAGLFNYFYPLTVDKRHRLVPFEKWVAYPSLPYPDNDCLLVAVHKMTGISISKIFLSMLKVFPKDQLNQNNLSVDNLDICGLHFNLNFRVVDERHQILGYYGVKNPFTFEIKLSNGHFYATKKRPMMMLTNIPKNISTRMPDAAKSLVQSLTNIPTLNWHPWQPETTRAEAYIRAMVEKTTGTLGHNPANLEILRSWDEYLKVDKFLSAQRYIAVIEGDPGSRKSKTVQDVLAKKNYQTDRAFMVSVPTTTLRDDWASKLDLQRKDPKTNKGTPGHFLTTFERSLTEGNWGWVNVRDEDKFPKGHLALTAISQPQAQYFVVLGDRYQSEWHEPNDRCSLNDASIPGELAFYSSLYSSNYYIGTWRFGPGIANFFNMPTFNPTQSGFAFAHGDIKCWQDLQNFKFPDNSDEYLRRLYDKCEMFYVSHAQKTWNEQIKEREVDTYAGSQGISAELAIVEVDYNALRGGNYQMIYTVLTRAKWVIIVTKWVYDGKSDVALSQHAIWRELYYYRTITPDGHWVKIVPEHTINIRQLTKPLPDSVRQILAGPPEKLQNWDFVKHCYPSDMLDNYVDPDRPTKRGGWRTMHRDDEVYKEAYNFKPYITELKEWQDPAPQVREPILPSAKVRVHVPVANENEKWELADSQLKERYHRELTFKNLYSTQLPDEYMVRRDYVEIRKRLGKEMGGTKYLNAFLKDLNDADNPIKFKPHAINWGQMQSNKDAASFAAGVAQRIRKMSYEENKAEFEREQYFGNAMFEALKKHMHWTHEIPFDDQAWFESIAEFQERRQDRSQTLKKMSLVRSDPLFQDTLTAKSQFKLKDIVPPDAKALQTLLVRSDSYIYKFGPVGVYLLRKILENCPKHIYYHAKKSVEDMMNWVAEYAYTDQYHEVDISGFDSTVRGGSVTNNVRVMQHFNIPQDLINDYVEDKLDFHTSTMHFGIMTFSGEIFTWLFNTIHEHSREALKYDLCDEPLMGSGDDILRFDNKPISEQWHHYEMYDVAVEKRYLKPVGSFCSYNIKDGKMWKDPILLWRRLQGQIELGKIEDVYMGYFLHFLTIYNLGDAMYNLLDEEAMEHQNLLSRIFFNLRKVAGNSLKVDWSKISEGIIELPEGIGLISGLFVEAERIYNENPEPLEASEYAQYTRDVVDIKNDYNIYLNYDG
jgi:hypothetical protein